MIISFALELTALQISTIWRCPMPRSQVFFVGSKFSLRFLSRDSVSSSMRLRSIIFKPFVLYNSRPRKIFSTTVMCGIRSSSWYMQAIPSSIALDGVNCVNCFPSNIIFPSSCVYAPVSIFINVDLPAPFSPTRPWTSPDTMFISTESRAKTPGNRLVIPVSSTNKLLSLIKSPILGYSVSKPIV